MGGPTFHAWYTVLVFGVIIVVILWAYRPKNKDRFDDIGRSVIDDKPDTSSTQERGQKQESKNNE